MGRLQRTPSPSLKKKKKKKKKKGSPLCHLISMRLEKLKTRCKRRSEAYQRSNGQNKCPFGCHQLPWSRRRACSTASRTPSKRTPECTLFDGGWLKTDRLSQWPKLGTFVCSICYKVGDNHLPLSYGHTQLNPPHPVRSAQLNSWWHSQYYGGGPHGNTMCCSFFLLFFYFYFYFFFSLLFPSLSFPPLDIE